MICGNCRTFSTKSVTDLKDHQKTKECRKANPMYKAVQAGAEYKLATAHRIVYKALGVTGMPMTDEEKEARRQYNLEHKDEIARRRKFKKQIQKETRETLMREADKLTNKRRRKL